MAELVWGEPIPAVAATPKLVLCADIVFDELHFENLSDTICTLLPLDGLESSDSGSGSNSNSGTKMGKGKGGGGAKGKGKRKGKRETNELNLKVESLAFSFRRQCSVIQQFILTLQTSQLRQHNPLSHCKFSKT